MGRRVGTCALAVGCLLLATACGARTDPPSSGFDDLSASDSGATSGGASGRGAGATGNGGALGTSDGRGGGSSSRGSGGASDCGFVERPSVREVESCADPEDESRFACGEQLYVDDDEGCEGLSPCFGSIAGGARLMRPGDTLVLLPGTYTGARIHQGADRRITSLRGPDETIIAEDCIVVDGSLEGPGELWIDHLTFRDCGNPTPDDEERWGILVTTPSNVKVRIQDNIFINNDGEGAIGLGSQRQGTHFDVVVARNRFFDHDGHSAAFQANLPPDEEASACVRLENNVFADNETAISVNYHPFGEPAAELEIVNNTLVHNQGGIGVNAAGMALIANNILFDNGFDISPNEELERNHEVYNNLLGNGQYTGLAGNFSADPLFLDADAHDYHLGFGSPAAGRGQGPGTPLLDFEHTPREEPFDVGAFHRDEAPGEHLAGLSCGDGEVQSGQVTTDAGTFRGFETCDDGNTEAGDGCSELCQWEPHPAPGQISLAGGRLCVLRTNGELGCWGYDVDVNMPSGSFSQVAVSQSRACALRSDGSTECWADTIDGTSFSPDETYLQIDADELTTCGLRNDGGVTCWDAGGIILSEDGPYARVDTRVTVCALDDTGDYDCWGSGQANPSGPFIEMYPRSGGGCGLRATGELRCFYPQVSFVDQTPLASLVRVSVANNGAVGLRPDGRVIQWDALGMDYPVQDLVFEDVAAADSYGCGLSADHRVHCWDSDLPQEL